MSKQNKYDWLKPSGPRGTMRQGVIAAGKEAGYTSVSNNSKVGLSKAGSEFNVGWKGAKQLRKDTMLTRGGGKAGFFRKLVNNITGNPLE